MAHVAKSRSSLSPACPGSVGLTLPEFLLGLALLASLPLLVWPECQAWVQRYKAQQAARTMVATLHMARLEGLRRGGQVVLGRLTGPVCRRAVILAPRDWSCGWELFVDANGDRQHDHNEVLVQQVRVDDGTQVQRSVDQGVIAFNARGQWAGLGLSFTFLPASGLRTAAVQLCASAGGRVRMVVGSTRCDSP